MKHTTKDIADYYKKENLTGKPVIFLDDKYADAFIGIGLDFRAVYDYDKMVAALVDGGMSQKDAEDTIAYDALACEEKLGPVVATMVKKELWEK